MRTIVHFQNIPTLMCSVVLSVVATGHARAGWESHLLPRDLNGDGTADAYYEPAQNITWLADADISQAAGFPAGRPNLNWSDSYATIRQLNVYGVTGWRLPTVTNLPQPQPTFGSCSYWADARLCGQNPDPELSEFAHLYYVSLGNSAGMRTNDGPFHDVVTNYWTGTEADSRGYLWVFSMKSGGQYTWERRSPGGGSWAVHDGDVGVALTSNVPEPESCALALSGLLITRVLMGRVRRKKR